MIKVVKHGDRILGIKRSKTSRFCRYEAFSYADSFCFLKKRKDELFGTEQILPLFLTYQTKILFVNNHSLNFIHKSRVKYIREKMDIDQEDKSPLKVRGVKNPRIFALIESSLSRKAQSNIKFGARSYRGRKTEGSRPLYFHLTKFKEPPSRIREPVFSV